MELQIRGSQGCKFIFRILFLFLMMSIDAEDSSKHRPALGQIEAFLLGMCFA